MITEEEYKKQLDEYNENFKNNMFEFMDCAKRCVKPYNELFYNLIMDAMEMMIIRIEIDGKINTEDKNNIEGFIGKPLPPKTQEEIYDTSNISEAMKKDIDNIVNEIINNNEENK